MKENQKLVPSFEPLFKGSFKVGDLITNIVTGHIWEADQFDVDSMNPEAYSEHLKFRKMIPLI